VVVLGLFVILSGELEILSFRVVRVGCSRQCSSLCH